MTERLELTLTNAELLLERLDLEELYSLEAKLKGQMKAVQSLIRFARAKARPVRDLENRRERAKKRKEAGQ